MQDEKILNKHSSIEHGIDPGRNRVGTKRGLGKEEENRNVSHSRAKNMPTKNLIQDLKAPSKA